MPCWYFDKNELRNTPSYRDGIEPEQEARYRREGARFLMECGINMGLYVVSICFINNFIFN